MPAEGVDLDFGSLLIDMPIKTFSLSTRGDMLIHDIADQVDHQISARWGDGNGHSHIRAKFPHIKVLVLTTYDDDEWVFDAIRAGALGYLLKDTSREKIIERETDVLRLIAKGFNNSEIANQLHLSEGTVRNHVSAILEKLGVSHRTQAAVIAIQHGL